MKESVTAQKKGARTRQIGRREQGGTGSNSYTRTDFFYDALGREIYQVQSTSASGSAPGVDTAGMMVNGDTGYFMGPQLRQNYQHSMIGSVEIVFNQPVTLTTGTVTLIAETGHGVSPSYAPTFALSSNDGGMSYNVDITYVVSVR